MTLPRTERKKEKKEKKKTKLFVLTETIYGILPYQPPPPPPLPPSDYSRRSRNEMVSFEETNPAFHSIPEAVEAFRKLFSLPLSLWEREGERGVRFESGEWFW